MQYIYTNFLLILKYANNEIIIKEIIAEGIVKNDELAWLGLGNFFALAV